MNFDIRTLFMGATAVVWMNALIMVGIWYFIRIMRHAIAFWSLSQILLGSSLILYSLRGMIPDVYSIILANAGVFLSYLAVQAGIACYVNKPAGLGRKFITLFLAFMTSMVYLTYIFPSVAWRIADISLFLAILSGISIGTLSHHRKDADNLPNICLQIVLKANIILMFFRILITISDRVYFDLMYMGVVQAGFIIGIFVLYMMLSLCLLWIIMHKMNHQVKIEAHTDILTGLPNRRALEEALVKQVLYKTKTVGIVMIDVDKFKMINDTYGHQAGDLYLKEASRIIADTFKQIAEVFRYAGDEFIVIVYDIERLRQVTNRLCKKVENLSVLWQEDVIHTTISVGFAINNDNLMNWAELIQMADKDLYRMKKERKNHL